MPFLVKAYVDGHSLTAIAEAARDAFAKAIEWHIGKTLTDVSISDGIKRYSIVEFSLVMALVEIAETIRTEVDASSQVVHELIPMTRNKLTDVDGSAGSRLNV